MHRLSRFLRYPRRQLPWLLVLLGLNALLAFATALQPWPLKLLVDQGLRSVPASPALLELLEGLGLSATPGTFIVLAALASLALFAGNAALEAGLTWLWTWASQRMVYHLAADLFHRFQRLSLMFHVRQRVGDLLSRLTGDTWSVATVTEVLYLAPARHLLTVISVGLLAWHLDRSLTLIALGLAPILGLAAFRFGGPLKQSALRVRDARAKWQSLVHQSLTALPLVQTFGLEERQGRTFATLASDMAQATEREARIRNGLGALSGIALAAGTGLVLYVGGQRVLADRLSLGSLLVFIGYLRSLQAAFQGLLSIYTQWQSATASLERVAEVLEAGDDVPEASDARPLTTRVAGHVRFENVTFGYEPGRPVLQTINLEAQPGEVIALVGASGAGKSTLASLIPRLMDPWEGRLLVDNLDVRSLRLHSLRAQVSVVLQEPFLLPLSVAQNIAYARADATRDEIIAAATAACADEFIRELPEGYDTRLAERGSTLSGGQRQRIAIARALVRNAPILILDEPSAALDPATEAQLMQALERLIHGRTTFIISHRFTTLRFATRIAVLENGRLAEVGTHAELLAQGGVYQRLYALQATEPRR